MKRLAFIFGLVFVLASFAAAMPPPTPAPIVTESDGTPFGAASRFVFTNGTVTLDAGVATIDITGGAGQPITLDLGDDAGDDSVNLGEIATTGDTNSIFTEPSADKLLIDVSKRWPTADVANAGDSATAFFSAGTIEAARLPSVATTSGGILPDTDGVAENWVPTVQADGTIAYEASASGVTTLAALTDTAIAAPAEANILIYDGTNSWDNKAVSGDITIAATGAVTIGNDKILEAHLKAVDAASDEDILTRETSTGDFEWHSIAELLGNISATQGTILYRNDTAWVALDPGLAGQYLKTGGAAANPSWDDPAGSGDITAVGDAASGAAFTADGSGNVLYFEGTTANDFEIALTGANPGADVTVTIPAETGTLVVGPAGFAADNRIIKTDGTGNKTQVTGITVADTTNSVTGITDLTLSGDLVVQGDDITMTTNTSGAVLVADGTNFNPVVMSGDVTIAANGATTIGNDKILTAHVNWGSAATQIDLDEVPDGTDYQRVAAADVDASGHVMRVYDSDGTGSITVTGPTDARAITIDDAAQTLAARNRDNTFTGSNTFGDGDTDTLTIRSLLIGGNSRALQVASSLATPTNATTADDLYVSGKVESGEGIYAPSFHISGTGESYLELASNATSPTEAGSNALYVVSNAWKIKENGTEKDIPTPTDSVTWTGTTHSFAGVTNMLLPSATPDAAGEIGISTTNNQLIWHDGAAVIKVDTTGVADGKILKYVSANSQFEIADDATAGAPVLSTIGDPEADTEIEFGAGEEVTWLFAGNYTTGSQFLISQATGNPTGGVLFEVRSADSDTVNTRLGDGTNYLQVSQAGNLSHGGTSSLVSPRVTTSIAPLAANGAALGTTALEWADAYFHDGAVIYGQADQSATLTSSASTWTANNFGVTGDLTVGDDLSLTSDGAVINIGAANDVTITHSANTLTLGGGDLALGANNLTMTGSIAATANRVTKGWFTDVESTNIPTVGGTAILSSITAPVFSTSIEAPFIVLGSAATAADAGAIRLANAANIAWEADAAGTDVVGISVDASEVVQIAPSGASGVTVTPDTTITGDLTVSGADVTIAAAGVKLTGSNGSLTILGLGDGQDEDVKIDLNSTANTIEITSPASSATTIDINTLNLVSTGTISGGIPSTTDADGMNITAAQAYGYMHFAGGAGTWNLPAVATGMSLCVYSTTAAAVVINPDNSDRIILNGTALADGDSITSASGAGDFICLMADSSAGWVTLGRSGTWTDTN